MKELLYLFSYLFFLWIAFPLSLVIPKLRRGLLRRLRLSSRLKKASLFQPYWFHVASSGEFEQCLPILDEIKKREGKKASILLTYFSPSAERAVEIETERRSKRELPLSWDYADYGPFDLPWTTRRNVRYLKPKAFIAIHREIWPFLLKAMKEARVKTYLFSTYWPDQSRKRFYFLRKWMNYFQLIGTVGDSTADFLKNELPHIPVEPIGDSRVDRVLMRKGWASPSRNWKTFFPSPTVFVGASLWSEDFNELKVGIDRALGADPRWRFLLVPHEPEDRVSKDIYAFFKTKGFPIRYWSSWLENPDTTSHILVNRIGYLAELFSFASVVFVGGSFKGRVHNVLEPAAYGCPILTGPKIWNSHEAVEMSREGGGLKVCLNAEDFSSKFLSWVNHEEERATAAKNTLGYIETHKGAAQRYAELLTSK